MCSNVSQPPPIGPPRTEIELATRLAAAIDELAATAAGDDSAVDSDLAQRLARAWAMIAAADPELAARTARYSH